ncbi:MAG: 3-hydroxyacyl-CoA dehydrogenase NAD-binding domain-containing protein [Bacteroidota bacterium]
MIRYKKNTNNIATLVLDMKSRPKNLINHELVDAFMPVLEHLKKEKSRNELRGVIITSNKRNFLEGGDLEYLHRASDPQEIFDLIHQLKGLFRAIESPGVPVVSAINGSALGAGFEMALASHHRIVIDSNNIRLGLPEVNLGLIPGGGGIIRLMWLLGIERAYEILTLGRVYRPKEALKEEIIDDIASDERELMDKAKDWILSTREGRRPWDQKEMSIPFGTAEDVAMTRKIRRLNIQLVKENQFHFPARHSILNILVEGSKVDFDTASEIESRYYTEVVCSKTAKNKIKAFYFDHEAIMSGENRPKGFGKFRPKKVGVIGAGLMGSGIATSCAVKGLEVVLKDVSKVIAERGKQHIADNLQEMLERNEIGDNEKEIILNKVQTTEKARDFETCDLVIEAVFENANLKQKVTQEAENYMDEFSFVGSNTLSIPISQLAEVSQKPENYVGLHFFPPAHRVPMVEIVKGKKTSDETIARAFDFVKAIDKIPVIVSDTWGFYAARVQNTFLLESITMLSEGYSPALVENLGIQAGMPRGGLSMADDLGLAMVLRYEEQASEHYGTKYIQHPAVEVLSKMIQELDRKGKSSGKGFYDYEHQSRNLWSELKEHFPARKGGYDRQEIIERFLFAQVIEAAWCLQEGVIETIAAANLGSIYGWGFPATKGGTIQYVFDYGKENFIARCKDFEKRFGQRFKVPSFLKRLNVDDGLPK